MKSRSYSRRIDTERAPQFIEITGWISECVAESGISNGFVVVYSRHTTAAVKINENEPLSWRTWRTSWRNCARVMLITGTTISTSARST